MNESKTEAPDDEFEIFYRTAGKALPPRPMRLSVPGWAGASDKRMEHGSEPQPWHCRPYSLAATSGVELLYQYEVECHAINDGGQLRLDWDYAREPGGVLGRDEFGLSEPRPAKFYTFVTSVDIQVPPGFVLQTQPHPRYFTDTTGTVPEAIIAQVETEWWPKKLFVVFKMPPPGGRHIFRKGEPYVQIIVLPARSGMKVSKMSPETDAKRAELEAGIILARSHIGKNTWLSVLGGNFDDHYKILLRSFSSGGPAAVESTIKAAVEKHQQALPKDLTFQQYLDLAKTYAGQKRYIDAQNVYLHLRSIDRGNPEVANGMGEIAAAMGLLELALQAISFAVTVAPQNLTYRANLQAVMSRLGRRQEAGQSAPSSLKSNPNPQ